MKKCKLIFKGWDISTLEEVDFGEHFRESIFSQEYGHLVNIILIGQSYQDQKKKIKAKYVLQILNMQNVKVGGKKEDYF